MTTSAVAATSPLMRRVRAYFAAVDRTTASPSIFDAAQNGSFSLDQPPAPWTDLGWCTKFDRKSATKAGAVSTGAPGIVQAQLITEVGATLSVQFESWGKLQLALSAGSQQMNLLQTAVGAENAGSGGSAIAAIPLIIDGNTNASQLNVGAAAAAMFLPGNLVAVDVDYTGQKGFVGSGVSGGYVKASAQVGGDANYIRRVTLNVGLVLSISDGVLQLASPLIAGAPVAGMKMAPIIGFVDREGGSFFQEWSALFVLDGEQGDRILFHYPRLQAMQGAAEINEVLAGSLQKVRLAGAFRALPVQDANDSEMVLCFRTYLPGAMRAI